MLSEGRSLAGDYDAALIGEEEEEEEEEEDAEEEVEDQEAMRAEDERERKREKRRRRHLLSECPLSLDVSLRFARWVARSLRAARAGQKDGQIETGLALRDLGKRTKHVALISAASAEDNDNSRVGER